jgi:hypothetical protein
MRYYKKINLANPVTYGDNKPIVFVPTHDGNGVIELDEKEQVPQITALDQCCEKRMLGVIRISKEIHDALLKKKASTPLKRPFDGLRVARQPDPFKSPKSQSPAAVAADQPPKMDFTNPPDRPIGLNQFRERARRLSTPQRQEAHE